MVPIASPRLRRRAESAIYRPMRAQGWLTVGIASLAIAASLQTAAFFVRADACWHLRRTVAERPPCCALAGQTRFTAEGGDCCKLLVLDETGVAIELGPAPVAAFALAAPVLRWQLVASRPRAVSRPSPFARGPPPSPFHPTATTVLRV